MNVRRVFSGLFFCIFFLSSTASAAGKSDVLSSAPEQKTMIEKVVTHYLLANPEILEKMSHNLQMKQQMQKQKDMTEAAIAHQAELLQGKGTPAYGPGNAKTAVVGFFDYQCVFCSRLAPVMDAVIQSNPRVRFIFKEWPIFSQRWDNSQKAAETGLRVWLQNGDDAYLSYHNSIFGTGHNEGRLTDDDIQHAATVANFDGTSLTDVQDTLSRINTLARQLGFEGTPGIIVMPTAGANPNNTTVITGITTTDALQAAIHRTIFENSSHR